MSVEKTKTTQESRFGIVNLISRKLKLGNFGKIESFIERVEKSNKKQIEALKKNISNTEFNAKNKRDELEDQLEDAEDDLKDAYISIDPDDVDTNEKQKAFMADYTANLTNCEENIAALNASIKRADDDLEFAVKDLNEQITIREARIKAITRA